MSNLKYLGMSKQLAGVFGCPPLTSLEDLPEIEGYLTRWVGILTISP